jgi:hypothetical protein
MVIRQSHHFDAGGIGVQRRVSRKQDRFASRQNLREAKGEFSVGQRRDCLGLLGAALGVRALVRGVGAFGLAADFFALGLPGATGVACSDVSSWESSVLTCQPRRSDLFFSRLAVNSWLTGHSEVIGSRSLSGSLVWEGRPARGHSQILHSRRSPQPRRDA